MAKMIYNKEIYGANVTCLANERNIDLKTIEKKVGISQGYLRRTWGSDITKAPGLDLVMRVADCLGVSMDMLLKYNYSSLSKREKFQIKVANRLTQDTSNGAIEWKEFNPSFAGKTDVDDLYTRMDITECYSAAIADATVVYLVRIEGKRNDIWMKPPLSKTVPFIAGEQSAAVTAALNDLYMMAKKSANSVNIDGTLMDILTDYLNS